MKMKATLYYRSKLDEHDQQIYDVLVEKWMHYEKNICIDIPHAELKTVTQAIHLDYPLLFYINYYQLVYVHVFGKIIIQGSYLYQKEETKTLLDRCEHWGNYILSHKPANIGTVELALWLHDVILNNVKYSSENGMRAHNIIGVISDGAAVCEGISMTYKFLCDLMGISCIYVSGLLNGDHHGWNMVWFNNESSFVDVTNDIRTGNTFGREKFLRSSDQMSGYTWDKELLPECRLRSVNIAER